MDYVDVRSGKNAWLISSAEVRALEAPGASAETVEPGDDQYIPGLEGGEALVEFGSGAQRRTRRGPRTRSRTLPT
jgi:hypothetical protein